jgi:hypothetical protein
MVVRSGSRNVWSDRKAYLPEPRERYRLDLLLGQGIDPRTGKPRAGFETVNQCRAEDRLRAVGLREIARTLTADPRHPAAVHQLAQLQRLNLDPQAAADLADRLDPGADTGRPHQHLRPTCLCARCGCAAGERCWGQSTRINC